MIDQSWWAGVESEQVPKLTNKELAERMAFHVSSCRYSGLEASPNDAWDMMLEAAKRLVELDDALQSHINAKLKSGEWKAVDMSDRT